MNSSMRQPLVFDWSDKEQVLRSLGVNSSVQEIDEFENQKGELSKTVLFGKSEVEKLKTTDAISAVGVYYAWDNVVVKTLPKEWYIAVRTSRNKYKITEDEQIQLSTKRVGVVGLSVGRVVSTTLALERSCGELRIADFDTLDLSNLNRLKAPLKHLGLLKTISTEQEIYGFDPFFSITSYDEGLTPKNIETFFSDGGKLDILIDECDSLELKIKMRQKAKELGIPVIMDTSDRGRIDIERYDLNPNLQLFNGAIGEFNPPPDWSPSLEENQMLLMQVLDMSQVSQRGMQSLQEIGKTISTWPQLGSSVVMGGGMTADLSRKILLGEPIPSGRFYIDLNELIANG